MKLRTKFEDEDFKLGEVVEADIVSHSNKDELKIIVELNRVDCIQ